MVASPTRMLTSIECCLADANGWNRFGLDERETLG
jgi:hypothetical protein